MGLGSLFLLIIFYIILTSVSNTEGFRGSFLNVRYKPVTRNIDTKNTKACSASKPLTVTEVPFALTTLINTGQSIQTNNQRHNAATVSGGPLNGNYIYLSFTYYWASNATTGVTGTTIDNKGFPYGVRVLYINEKYTTFQEALVHEDGFADLVFLFNICSTPNKGFGKVSKKIQAISKAGSFTFLSLKTNIQGVDYISVNPKYYTYKGEFLDTYTKKKYKSATVFIFKLNQKACITLNQFNQTFNHLMNFKGEPLSNTLTHDSSELQSFLYAGVAQP